MVKKQPKAIDPLFYVKGDHIYQRPVRSKRGFQMGFCVCVVEDGLDPVAVCEVLNKGEPATE